MMLWSDNISCFLTLGAPGSDGTLMANPRGGYSPYSYLWSDGQTTQQAVGLTYTEYTVTVTDSGGCTTVSSYTMTAAPELIPEVAFNDPTCEGLETGVINIINTEGGHAPYSYAFNEAIGFSSDTTWTGLSEGVYEIFIQDDYGCIVSVEEVINAPQIPVVSFADDLTIFLGDSIQLEPIVNAVDLQSIQ